MPLSRERPAREAGMVKILDVLLNVVMVLAIVVFSSYVAFYYYGIGLFASLPGGVGDFFLDNGVIQWVVLAVLVAAVIGKIAVRGAMRRRVRSET
ncbi:hypothetical protein [Microbacterium murale]|uniref:Polyferredoxin n=1 Tax=Microbacterium murale TaxID=1081040 RepID=A0ABU0PAJ2_9MICO|nr:hypothetical protein [Microbacterium murale]MDQ0644354.1 polyferredoxin [Microbacterium murale]